MSAQTSYYNHPEGEHDDPLPEVIWYRVDGGSNGRWLYVDHPNGYYGGITVGIQWVYRKHLSSGEARAMAAALLQAADEWDVLKPELDAERQRQLDAIRRCEDELGGHQWPIYDWLAVARGQLKVEYVCQRCGVGPKTTVTYGSAAPERP